MSFIEKHDNDVINIRAKAYRYVSVQDVDKIYKMEVDRRKWT